MNVRIVNFFGDRNCGDELMFRSVLGNLRHHIDNATFSATCLWDEQDVSHFPQVTFYPPILRSKARGEIFVRLHQIALYHWLLIAVSCRPDLAISLMPVSIGRNLRNIMDADLVVTTGGPFFSENISRTIFGLKVPTFGFLLATAEVKLAIALGKPTWIIGQSIGPFSSKATALVVAKLLRGASEFWCREPETTDRFRLQINMPKKSLVVLPDLALSRRIDYIGTAPSSGLAIKLLRHLASLEKLKVGINIRHLPPITGNLETLYIDRISELVLYLIQDVGAYVVLICQAIDNDADIAHIVKSRVGGSDRLFVTPEPSSAREFEEFVAVMDVVCTTRYHATVTALKRGVPFLAIEYDPKVKGVVRMTGLDSVSLTLTEMLSGDLPSKMSAVIERRLDLKSYLERVASDCDRTLSEWFMTAVSRLKR